MSGNRAHILLVDDHSDTLEIVARLLRSGGYKVQTAPGPQEAIEWCRSERFDLIISDVQMPDMSGMEMLSRLRHLCDTPAIALSALGMAHEVAAARAAGFTEHLLKPVDMNHLLEVVARLVDPPVPPATGGKK